MITFKSTEPTNDDDIRSFNIRVYDILDIISKNLNTIQIIETRENVKIECTFDQYGSECTLSICYLGGNTITMVINGLSITGRLCSTGPYYARFRGFLDCLLLTKKEHSCKQLKKESDNE